LFSEWTQKNRRQVRRLAGSILKKNELGQKLNKDEESLYYKVEMFFERACFTQEEIDEQNLTVLGLLKQISENPMIATNFAKDASKQNISESAQKKHMTLRGFEIEKLSASGKNSLRFGPKNETIVSKKVEGLTSRSFDFVRQYGETVEYFLGKVCWGQGGHQNSVKDEIVKFLKSANQYLVSNPNSKMVFTALVDGDAITQDNVKEYSKYTSSKVRFFNSDEYEPYT
jgi:hypothetical protein